MNSAVVTIKLEWKAPSLIYEIQPGPALLFLISRFPVLNVYVQVFIFVWWYMSTFSTRSRG